MMTKNDELQFRTIDYLRFPLIVGVLFIHNFSVGSSGDFPVCRTVMELFSHVLGSLAVPAFFLISGFLFFRHTETGFSGKAYAGKLKKRTVSLLVPYLFWNVAVLLLFFLLSRLPFLSGWFAGRVECSPRFFVSALWGIPNDEGTMTYPIAYPFWFIRDLFVMVLLSPVVYRFLRNTAIWGLLALGLFWGAGGQLPVVGIYGLSSAALFFFSAGGWFAVRGKNLLSEFRKTGRWTFFLYPCLALADLLTKWQPFNACLHRLGIVAGVVMIFLWVGRSLERGRIAPVPFLSAASFFVFAVHEPWLLAPIRKVLLRLFQPESDAAMVLIYFAVVGLTVASALVLYRLSNRFLPRFTKIVTGGR